MQSLLVINTGDKGLGKNKFQKPPYCTGVESLKAVTDQRENIKKKSAKPFSAVF